MDRVFQAAVPEPVAALLDVSLDAFVEEPSLAEEAAGAASSSEGVARLAGVRAESFLDVEPAPPADAVLVRLATAEPLAAPDGRAPRLVGARRTRPSAGPPRPVPPRAAARSPSALIT